MSSTELLSRHPASGRWSVLENLEHLNRYGNFYLPKFERRLERPNTRDTNTFRSGWLGDYFAKSMLPGSRPIRTFASMDPAGSQLDQSVCTKFIKQQHWQLELLDHAGEADLSRTRCSISIAPWLSIRLGDAFRVVIYHNQRHLRQAQQALREVKRDS